MQCPDVYRVKEDAERHISIPGGYDKGSEEELVLQRTKLFAMSWRSKKHMQSVTGFILSLYYGRKTCPYRAV